MSKHTVFIADDFDLTETMDGISEKLRAMDIEVIRGPQTIKGTKLQYQPEDYERLFGKAEVAMFSSRSICSREMIEYAPNLIGIVNPTIGVDTVDVKAANEKGIIIGNGACPENYIEMAEATVMLMLMLMYDPNRSAELVKKNLPKPVESQHWAHMMWKKTVGLVGFGRIARCVAERLQGWDMNILTFDPYLTEKDVPSYVKLCSFEDLLRQSDIVSLHTIVTDETRGMMSTEQFRMMKPTAYFINDSRGQLVDEDALCEALEKKWIAGAALDTFMREPLPADSPLRKFDNLFLTPHIVGHALDCILSLPDVAVQNICNILNGELPTYCVNPQIKDKWLARRAELMK